MRFILCLSLLLSSLALSAQYDLINRKIIRQDSAFLYRREDNEVVIKGFKPGRWGLTTDNGQVTATDSPYLFIIEPEQAQPTTLRLSRNGAIVLTKVFLVVYQPAPKARWGAIYKDTASVIELFANKQMMIVVEGCDCSRDYRVFGFEVELTTSAMPEAARTLKATDNGLTAEMASAIRLLKPGDKISFKEVRVGGKNSRIRSIPGPTIVIR